jgi:hypothetical protein
MFAVMMMTMMTMKEVPMTATSFEIAPASASAPRVLHTNSTPNDPLDVLEGAAAAKWTALCPRSTDLFAAGIRFEDAQELSHTGGRFAPV